MELALGKAPFVGQIETSADQREDLKVVWGDQYDGYLDYVTCWLKEAADCFSNTTGVRFALSQQTRLRKDSQSWHYSDRCLRKVGASSLPTRPLRGRPRRRGGVVAGDFELYGQLGVTPLSASGFARDEIRLPTTRESLNWGVFTLFSVGLNMCSL